MTDRTFVYIGLSRVFGFVYIYIYIYTHTHTIYIYIYIYIYMYVSSCYNKQCWIVCSHFCLKCDITLWIKGCVTCIQETVCYQQVYFVCVGVRYTHYPFSETLPSSPALPCSSTVYPNDMCYVSPASSVTAVCSMPQYFKQELYFKQLTGFYFFTSQNKRDRSW